MTLIVSHGSRIYADRKHITTVAGNIQAAAEHDVKLVKIPGAVYGKCGRGPVTKMFEDVVEESLQIDIAAIVALDWVAHNLPKITGFSEELLREWLPFQKRNHLATVMLEPIRDYLEEAGRWILLKTPYSTFVISGSMVDTYPNNIPYAMGSFENHALEMLAARAPVEDIYRMSHETGCMTSKEYDVLDLSDPEFSARQPDIFNMDFHIALHQLLARSFRIPRCASYNLSSDQKDEWLLVLINLCRLLARLGRRSNTKRYGLRNVYGSLSEETLRSFMKTKFVKGISKDDTMSYKARELADMNKRLNDQKNNDRDTTNSKTTSFEE